jgi:hypothetical protein
MIGQDELEEPGTVHTVDSSGDQEIEQEIKRSGENHFF